MPLASSLAAILGPIPWMLISRPTAHARARAGQPAGVPEKMPFDIDYGAPISLDDAQKAVAASMAWGRGTTGG